MFKLHSVIQYLITKYRSYIVHRSDGHGICLAPQSVKARAHYVYTLMSGWQFGTLKNYVMSCTDTRVNN